MTVGQDKENVIPVLSVIQNRKGLPYTLSYVTVPKEMNN